MKRDAEFYHPEFTGSWRQASSGSNDIFTFYTPGTIIFGNDSLSRLPQTVSEFSAKSICVVTDPGVSDAGILENR